MYRNILRNSHFFQLGCSLYSTHNTASVQRENGLLLVCSMERFLPPAGGSSASSMVTCGEPTCPMKSALITAVHKCPCGRAMHGFCGRGIGEEGFGQQRESVRPIREGHLETRLAPAAVRWKWTLKMALALNAIWYQWHDTSYAIVYQKGSQASNSCNHMH